MNCFHWKPFYWKKFGLIIKRNFKWPIKLSHLNSNNKFYLCNGLICNQTFRVEIKIYLWSSFFRLFLVIRHVVNKRKGKRINRKFVIELMKALTKSVEISGEMEDVLIKMVKVVSYYVFYQMWEDNRIKWFCTE